MYTLIFVKVDLKDSFDEDKTDKDCCLFVVLLAHVKETETKICQLSIKSC